MRQTLGEVLLSKVSDPRIDVARTSITSVEVAEDLLSAKVYVSVLGSEADQRKALRALQHAGGRLQEQMMSRIRLRHTPVLTFVVDEEFKRTMATLEMIEKAMDEIQPREDGADDETSPTEP
jgi:ribosome-binding factor A